MASMHDPKHWNQKGLAQHYAVAELMTRPPASEMVQRTLPGDLTPLSIFDNAAGTGPVTESILNNPSLKLDGANILCGDISADMIAAVQAKIDNNDKWKTVTAKVIDSQDTKLPDNAFTHVFINFGIFLVGNPDLALKECLRVLRPGGCLAFTSWSKAGWLDDAQEAIKRVPGTPEILKQTYFSVMKKSGDWDSPEWIQAKVTQAGFTETKVDEYDFAPKFGRPETFVASAAAVMAPLLTAGWPEDVKVEHWSGFPKLYQTLLEEKYGEDGPVTYPCGALITVARKPR